MVVVNLISCDIGENKITPTPVPEKKMYVRNVTNVADFNQVCKGKGVFCVVGSAEEAALEDVARKYRNDKKFMFWMCAEQCSMDFARVGIWILHHRRDAAIRLEGLGGIERTLDRVLDGGAQFTPIEKLTQREL
jgi:hypothetical protein